MFPCEKCNGPTRILKTHGKQAGTRRRRKCVECGHKFATVEVTGAAFMARVRKRALQLAADLKDLQALMRR